MAGRASTTSVQPPPAPTSHCASPATYNPSCNPPGTSSNHRACGVEDELPAPGLHCTCLAHPTQVPAATTALAALDSVVPPAELLTALLRLPWKALPGPPAAPSVLPRVPKAVLASTEALSTEASRGNSALPPSCWPADCKEHRGWERVSVSVCTRTSSIFLARARTTRCVKSAHAHMLCCS